MEHNYTWRDKYMEDHSQLLARIPEWADILHDLKKTNQEDVDPVWVTRSDGRRLRIRNLLVRDGGHFIPSHVEIISVPELVSFWDHPTVGGHRIGQVVEVAKLMVEGHVFTSEEDEYWTRKTNHEPHSYQSFKNNVYSILENGYLFEEQIYYGGKNCCIPRINREAGEPVDGRHRVATAYALGAAYIPGVIHTSDRYFDDGTRTLTEVLQMIREFFTTSTWTEYQQSESYRILSVR